MVQTYLITINQYCDFLRAASVRNLAIIDEIASELAAHEVIFCKDCDYCDAGDQDGYWESGAMYCQKHDYFREDVEGFCSDAVRRE